ncbi:heavy metal-associated isoprenylated plant protein 28 [Quercus suber]|uniref:Heavy metal-associated isoprenylated plant protein 28 n=1 Tax=Quercus suber TaxID=58331 RepID=A0AAW0M7T2_QUESU
MDAYARNGGFLTRGSCLLVRKGLIQNSVFYESINDNIVLIIEMRVHMDCAGCEGKVKDTLQKLKGVDDIEIDMATQKVTVTGWADQKKVLKAVRKTGRRAELWQLPYNPEHQDYTYHYYNQHNCNGPLTYYAPQPASSYNYYKHGYNDQAPSYHQNPSHSMIFGYQTVFCSMNCHSY